jgi:hypothetical protein
VARSTRARTSRCQPQMIVVDGLINAIKKDVKRDTTEALAAMNGLRDLLNDRLSMTVKIELKDFPEVTI